MGPDFFFSTGLAAQTAPTEIQCRQKTLNAELGIKTGTPLLDPSYESLKIKKIVQWKKPER